MIYGFTGTSRGMSFYQQSKFLDLCFALNVTTLHHGDCVGADYDAHGLIHSLPKVPHIVIHPSNIPYKHAFCCGNEYREPKAPLTRNKDIVREGVGGLIAAPYGFTEVLRSGTWATIRAARKLNRYIWIVFPDGTIKNEVPLRNNKIAGVSELA